MINASDATLYHTVARGPSFALGADTRAAHDTEPSYLHGKIHPQERATSLVQNAFVLSAGRNGTGDYFLFVEWFGPLPNSSEAQNNSLSRVYVGRSRGSPIGPFIDRIGNDMNRRSEVVLGDQRTISIVSAAWGANCDGTGYDVSGVARLRCEGQSSCDWIVRHQDLDSIDPSSYSDSDFSSADQTVAGQHGDANNDYADRPGCPRSLNVTYRCTKNTAVLYESETRGEELHSFVPGEAANGSIARLRCETPPPVLVPGGTLFADPQRLGGNLHFQTIGHSGVFRYARRGEMVHVFTFQYHTSRSTTPEFGARRIRFAADGWPVLAEDFTAQWATCNTPEAAYDHIAPSSYHQTESHYDAATSRQAHYLSSSSTRTHCKHHSDRGTHCVGDSLRATHPQIGVAGPEGSTLHGRINEEGTDGYWREQEDHCNPLVETQLGRPLTCTRFAGRGDINSSGHVTTMERIRGCPRLSCSRRSACRPDPNSRALGGTRDTCTDGFECKRLPELRVAAWDSNDFFDNYGHPLVMTRDGFIISRGSSLDQCHATPRISRIDPALGVVHGGTIITVHGTGFGHPARCRFGWLETSAENITAHSVLCKAPALNQTFIENSAQRAPRSVVLERLLHHPVMLEVSMMSAAVLAGMPLTDAVREARGENFTNDQLAFQYYDPTKVAVSFLRPQGGPTEGATHIDVHGSGFKPSDANSNIKCRFTAPGVGVVTVQASYHNSERISCFSPNVTSNVQALVDVTFNEQEYFGKDQNFTFYSLHNANDLAPLVSANVVISSIHPIGGPARGGTILTILGVGFAPFGDPGGSMESVVNRELHTLRDGIHDLHRSVISRTGLFCLFDGVDVIVHGAAPAHEAQLRRGVVMGMSQSTTEITCQTPPFQNFGDVGTDANVSIEITLNGNPSERTASGLTFSFYREDRHLLPKLHAVQPFGGPASGGTLLTIYGSLLRKLTSFGGPTCRFGSAAENTTTPATVMQRATTGDGQMVLCVAPPLPGDRERRDVSLNVAQNGDDYLRRALRFRYYPLDKLVVQRLQPSGGPAAGGTDVLLSGRRIGMTRGGLQCSFGETWVHATSVTEDSVRCVSPARSNLTENVTTYPWVHEAVRVTVNDDRSAASHSAQPFTYFEPEMVLAVSSIYPRSGDSDGGNAITVYGRGFRDLGGVRCRFGVAAPVLAEAPPPPPSPRPAPGRDGDLRLANGGPSGLEGRVEIYHDGVWGTVCDDYWDMEDARTVCRQLGAYDAVNASTNGVYGPGSGPIWLDNVNCAPGAERLDRCGSQGWGVHDCDHHEDAGVRCVLHPSNPAPTTPPAGPPPPREQWSRLDDYQLTRSADGAHLGWEVPSVVEYLATQNASEFSSLVCRSPPLHEALGPLYNHRAVVRTVEVQVTINGHLYGRGQNYTYYPL